MKKIFSQKFAFLISILSIVFGVVGMAIDTSFFAKVFLFGMAILAALIVWKLYLISKGKEKWGVY